MPRAVFQLECTPPSTLNAKERFHSERQTTLKATRILLMAAIAILGEQECFGQSIM